MATTIDTTKAPAGLRFDPATDPQRGRHLLLGAPWGARVHPLHESEAGELVDRDYFGLPPKRWLTSGDLPVNIDHDPRKRAGRIVDGDIDDTGVWLVVHLDDEGEAALPSSRGVSLEVIDVGSAARWTVSGVALVVSEHPAIPGSRVVFDAGRHRVFAVELVTHQPDLSFGGGDWLRRVAREADVSGGRVVLNGQQALPNPVVSMPTVVDLGERRREAYAMSMAAVDDDTAYRRRMFAAKREQYAAMAVEDEKQNLIASMTPHSAWPLHTRERQGWDARLKAREAAREAERAERERVAREQESAAVAALQASWRDREATASSDAVEPKVRMSWWSRLLRRHSTIDR